MNFTPEIYKPCFAWFGGKARVAAEVWARFGNPDIYREPFCGSCAVLFARHGWRGKDELVLDKDCLLTNFWRAVKYSPDKTAEFADYPIIESDLHARHLWLVNKKPDLQAKMEGDPYYHDPQIAGWWVWAISQWLGGEFCSGKGPWKSFDGEMVKKEDGDTSPGVNKPKPKFIPQGINRRDTIMANAGLNSALNVYEYFDIISQRLRGVVVYCGDWERAVTPVMLGKNQICSIFFDPPYSSDVEHSVVYSEEDMTVAKKVEKWCIENGDNLNLRIALCGYEGCYKMPDTWDVFQWSAQGGYGNQRGDGSNDNRFKERIWFSPGCEKPKKGLFDSILEVMSCLARAVEETH